MKKLAFLFAFLGFLFVACDKTEVVDEPEQTVAYEVEIDIIRPEPGTASDFLLPVGIEVEFKRNGLEIIENVLIEIFDKDGLKVETLVDENVHAEGIYTYVNDQGYQPAVRGEYTLRASSSDQDGNEIDPVEVTFIAQ